MNRDRILSILREHRETLKTMGLKSMALFGSVARDEAHLTSDVDLLVEFEPPLTFDRYMDMKFYLEDLLGTKVDLVTRNSLKVQIRDRVEQEAINCAEQN
jgi:uncharacterized protein